MTNVKHVEAVAIVGVQAEQVYHVSKSSQAPSMVGVDEPRGFINPVSA